MIAVRFIAIVAAIVALYARSCNAEPERKDESEIVPPIIDFSRLTYDMPLIPIDLFEQIEDALTNHGAFVAVNHSVWLTDQQRAFGAANNLFSLPLQEKESLQFNQTDHFGRGYLSFGAESGLSANFEPKEGYSFGHPKHLSYSPEKTWLRSPNLWPKDWTEHEIQPFNNIYEKFSSLAELFLSFIIYARKVYRGKSTNIMVGGGSEISILRLFHYFPIESELVQQALAHQESQRGKERILGSSPHTDWGLLTIIMQNSVTGLQYRKNQKWVNVPYIPESLIFNCGDYFSLATNGDYHAPVHRVLSPQSQERLSFVYFFYPHFDSPLTWDKSVQNTAVVDASGNSNVKKEVAQPKADEELEYNTLSVLNYEELSVSDYDKARTEKFGDYIIKKWQGVYRG
jgi:isopenicillin N synthase-like dioxygenase